MLRKDVASDYTEKSGFRWRGHEVSRIEDFSDSVFAITIALLLVSVEVPNTFEQLVFHMKGFIGFSFAFAFLIYLWHAHYLYFRRFGLKTTAIIWMNGMLLFLIMFYSYPLKFLVNKLFQFSDQARVTLTTSDQARDLMIYYGLGLIAIFLFLIIMYIYAYKQDQLELNKIEKLACKAKFLEYSIMIFWGTVSVILTIFLPDRYLAISGLIYCLIGPSMFVGMFYFYGKRYKKLLNEID